MVELVLESEVGLTRSLTFGTGAVLLSESCDVTAGAEGFGPGAADYYYTG